MKRWKKTVAPLYRGALNTWRRGALAIIAEYPGNRFVFEYIGICERFAAFTDAERYARFLNPPHSRKQFRKPTVCPFPRRAWTGGDMQSPDTLDFRRTVSFFFREQLRECGGLDCWKCAGTSSIARARIFWERAKSDAWATVRETLR